MQPIVVVTGVATQRFVRIPATAPDDIDAEAIFVAANRVESSLEADLANLRRPYQKQLRRDLDSYGAPSMSAGDFIVVRFSTNPIVINGRWMKRPAGEFAIIECVTHDWNLLLTDNDESLQRQAADHWSTYTRTQERT